jgi:tetratricopeptide (TPR) repeat protein
MRSQMRSSLLLPIALGLIILLGGVLVAMFAPWSFMGSTAGFIVLVLIIYLFWTTRKASWPLRLLAILLAVPAILGIAYGLVNGSIVEPLAGIGLTVILLTGLRFFSTPISYRVASRRFNEGDLAGALDLVNRSIEARPDFWESYQLRALIYLAMLSFGHAEKDAQKAIELNPEAHPVYNTLGLVYLAQERFGEAEEVYGRALDLAPGYALYLYHLGLSEFRQGNYQDAVESFIAATHGTLPLMEYDLQNAYYLTRALEEVGNREGAQTAAEEMQKYSDAIEPLKRQVTNLPEYPHVARIRKDVADMENRLSTV